jgi:hypothetical protein
MSESLTQLAVGIGSPIVLPISLPVALSVVIVGSVVELRKSGLEPELQCPL